MNSDQPLWAAIDIDGTVTRYPEVMRILLHAHPDTVLLTGCSTLSPDTIDRQRLWEDRIRQLEPLIGRVDRHIEICVGRNSAEVAEQKAIFCRDHSVKVFIDDSPDYCEAVRRLSPQTAILRVWP